MSHYKNSIMRELGIRENKNKILKEDEGVDPKELEMGIEDETGQTGDEDLAKKIAMKHLQKHGDFYSKTTNSGVSARDKMMSPTAIATPIIGVAVRGSSTGGLPSGADQRGKDITPTNLGGYEKISIEKDNSEIVDKTPKNPDITSGSPISNSSNTEETPHPHQIQQDANEAPQNVTGADTDGEEQGEPSMKLQDLTPKQDEPEQGEGEVDVDVAEEEKPESKMNEGKHKSGCTCGFCSNKKRFGKKDKEEDKDDDKVSDEKLMEIRNRLQEKAAAGKMNKKESEVFKTITEVLQKRGQGLEQKLFGKKTLLETANVIKEINPDDIGSGKYDSIGMADRAPMHLQKAKEFLNDKDYFNAASHARAAIRMADRGHLDHLQKSEAATILQQSMPHEH